MRAKRQNIQLELALGPAAKGEARRRAPAGSQDVWGSKPNMSSNRVQRDKPLVELFLALDAWANTRAATRGDSNSFGAVAPECDDLRIASSDNAAHGYAPVEADEFPLRLRRPAIDHALHPCVQAKLVGSGEQHLVGRRVDLLRTEQVRAFVQKLRAKFGDGAAKPAYIFTERGVDYRMPRPGSAGLRTPFRERRTRARSPGPNPAPHHAAAAAPG